MDRMFTDTLQTLAGIFSFSLLFVAPGYILANLSNIMSFRSRSMPERLLWAVALSGPVSTLLAAVAGRWIPLTPLLTLFLTLGVTAAVLLFRDILRAPAQDFGRAFWIICAYMGIVALYCLFATLGIETRHALYENIDASDWNIRFPLVQAAVRGGIPPHNPFFALHGIAPPMRYYYFWYELCAQVVRLTHIPARAAFMAGNVWSFYSLIASMLLVLKYLGNHNTFAPVCVDADSTPKPASLRSISIVAVGLVFVMGLDLLAAIAGLLFHRVRLMPEIEAWRPDRMPSWIGATLVASHHVAGLGFGAVGFLVLALLPEAHTQHAHRRAWHALLAGVCFAALAGTSTYLAACFALAVLLLALLRLRDGQWREVGWFALCSIIAFLLAAPFLRDFTSSTGLSVAGQVSNGPHALLGNQYIKVVLRNWHFSYGVVGFFAAMWHISLLHNPLRYLLPLMLVPVLLGMELTFFVFVIWYQAKWDWSAHGLGNVAASGGSATHHARSLWILFLAFALPGLLLSSEPTQGVNDLGRHTGLALRLVLIVWAAPMLANTWKRLRAGCKTMPRGRWVVRLTLAAIAIGIVGQLWQVTLERIYLPLVAHGVVKSRLHDHTDRMLEIRSASEAAAAAVPPSALLQSNPEGADQMAFRLYTSRQMAAGDESCEAAFGGSIVQCRAIVLPPLHALFGGSGRTPPTETELHEAPADPTQMNHASFAAACAELRLSALLAASADPAWQVRDSWVWTEPVLYADDSVRVIPCPAR